MTGRRGFLKRIGVSAAAGAGLVASPGTTAGAGDALGDGVNLQPSYFCDGDQALGWELMDEYPAIETVRIEIEPPSWGESAATLSDARRWIDEAAGHGYDVIATCHHYPNNGSSDRGDLLDAAQWWVDNYDYLSANTAFTVNLHNEWGSHETTREAFADAYNEAISTVRSGTDYTGPIVVDIPGWGQAYQVAADASDALEDDDLVLSAHIYPSAWNADQGRWVEPGDLEYLDRNSDYPCLVGEFGSRRDGEADWSALVDTATALGWPVLGWAWNGDGESMNMTTPYWGEDCGVGSYGETDYFDVVYRKLGAGDTEPDESTLAISDPDGELDGFERDYEVAVTDSLTPTDSVNPHDSVGEASAVGLVDGGTDEYTYTGELAYFGSKGATLSIDGEAVDPANYVEKHTIIVDETEDAWTSYEFEVDGSAEAGAFAGGGPDSVDGTTVSGAAKGYQDSYRYTGEITAWEHGGDGAVTVYVDGEAVDPDTFGDDLLVDDFDTWAAGTNDLGNWTSADEFENGSGEVVDGALELEYDDSGWLGTEVQRDISGYSELVLRIRGDSGDETDDLSVEWGDARTNLAELTDDTIGTDFGDVAVPLDAIGVDTASPGKLLLNFWQGANGTVAIEELRLV